MLHACVSDNQEMQYSIILASFLWLVVSAVSMCHGLDGGTLRMNPRNDWRAFEVISRGDNPTGDSVNWSMPTAFDGLGAWLPVADTLRLSVNHENTDATISEVNLRLADFRTAIRNTIVTGSTSGITFVDSAGQAYDRWSNDGGVNWIATSSPANTSFYRFCSGQSYQPNTFGLNRGFVDPIYITGEEGSTDRLFALDLVQRDFYRLSGVSGSAAGGIGGMPADAWENAALLDTGESDHIALLLSPDGGSQKMQIYIGEKGKDLQGNAASDFLARNGLAYGSYYYLNDTLPSGVSTDGTFGTLAALALTSSKLEDIDTSPTEPTRAVLGDQDSGLFTFDFDLDFSSGSFNSATSGFSIERIQPHINDVDGLFGDADNVDWTAATTLGGINYAEGLIFVNEDSGTNGGEVWVKTPAAGAPRKIADTIGISGATESSGILDISELVGYVAGSVLLTNNQGSNSSLSVLINPLAATQLSPVTLPGDYNDNGIVDAADFTVWRDHLGDAAGALLNDPTGLPIGTAQYELWTNRFGDSIAATLVPEPRSGVLLLTLLAFGIVYGRRGV